MSTALNDIIGPDAVVKRIVERMSNATLLEDKKTALNELREKAAEHPEPVARLAQALLLEWMPAAKEDLETLRGILGTLQECLASEREEAFREANSRNAVSFAKEPNNISILLENLEINDWAVRLAVLKMLAAMERFCPAALSSAILASAQGPARLMDVLSDQREIIRNEVLLVLSGLTGGGKELELNKILAFEGAFDVLFGIVASDEEGPESVIVRDCLTIALNLLHNNPSNVSYFREMGCVGNHVVPLLRKAGGVDGSGMGASQTLWGAVCSLLAGLITWADDSQKMQTNMGKQGVIEIVMAAVAGGGLSVESKGHGLRLVGSLVHVHTPNRLLLSSIMLQGGSTALGAVLRMCLEELEIGQDPQHSLNAAAAFLFQCYLHQNVDGQQHLAATLMPQPSMDDEEEGGMEEPVGRQVMKAVLLIDKADDRAISAGNPDALAALTKVWGAATVLGLILHNNSVCQEIAVASPLELPSAGAPEMFLPSLLAALSKGSAAQGGGIDGRGECFLLQLFAIWLHNCPSAAHAMSSEPSHVMWLVGLLGSTPGRERMPERVALQVRGCASLVLASCLQFAEDSELLSSIIGIIESRVGLQVFQQHITLMLKSEPFLAAKRRTEGGSAMGAGGGGGGKGAPEHAAWAFPVFSPEFATVAAQVAEGLQKKMLKIMGGPGSPVRGVDESVVRERDALRDQLKELQAQLEEAGGGKGGEEERDQALRRCEEVEEVLREREMEARALREAKEEADKELKALMHSNRALEEEVERKSAEVDDLQLKLANGS